MARARPGGVLASEPEQVTVATQPAVLVLRLAAERAGPPARAAAVTVAGGHGGQVAGRRFGRAALAAGGLPGPLHTRQMSRRQGSWPLRQAGEGGQAAGPPDGPPGERRSCTIAALTGRDSDPA
jgi:hypothetical protein